MSKLKGTLKVNNCLPHTERGSGADNGFVFSDDVADWQYSKKKKYSFKSYRKNKPK